MFLSVREEGRGSWLKGRGLVAFWGEQVGLREHEAAMLRKVRPLAAYPADTRGLVLSARMPGAGGMAGGSRRRRSWPMALRVRDAVAQY